MPCNYVRKQRTDETDEEYARFRQARMAENRAKAAIYREKNRDKCRAYQRKYMEKYRADGKATPNHVLSEQKRARYAADPERYRAYAKRHRDKDRGKINTRSRASNYGLTPAEVEALLAASGGACECCGKVPPPIKGRSDPLHIDHHHETGAVRGIVCAACNRDLSAIDKGPEHVSRLLAFAARPDIRTKREV